MDALRALTTQQVHQGMDIPPNDCADVAGDDQSELRIIRRRLDYTTRTRPLFERPRATRTVRRNACVCTRMFKCRT